jgi:hypothetical protein
VPCFGDSEPDPGKLKYAGTGFTDCPDGKLPKLVYNYYFKKTKTMRNLSVIFLFIFAVSCGGTERSTFMYTSDDFDLDQALTYTDLTASDLPGSFCIEANEELIPAQAEPLTDTETRIWWFANQPAGETVEYTIHRNEECSDEEYSWVRTGDQSIKLQYNGQPLIQYEHPVYDRDDAEHTKKPFHHVFDPLSDHLITKGPGGLYSHHRGIFFGYNHVYVNDGRVDIWHANDGERSEHVEVIREITGPAAGGHVLKIHWKDRSGDTFIEETRDVRVSQHTDNSFFIDFKSVLNPVHGPVRLEGDLQHAGVQFRAAQYVADNAESTVFIRPDRWSDLPPDEELDEENWNDLPWNAMNFNIEGNEYTVAYLSHPANPGGSEMSERRYGRFGQFFPYHLTEDNPLELRYRFWIISGEAPSAEEIEEVYQFYLR